LLGAAIAGVLVFAFGAAFVALGAYIAGQSSKVGEAWAKTADDIKIAWSDAGKALEPVLLHGIELMGKLADAFLPHFEEAMRGAAGPLSDFLDHVAAGIQGFGKRAWDPLMEGFDAFLLAFGPDFEGLLNGMGDSFGALGRTVRDHSGEISMAVTAILGLVTTLIDVVNFLANAWIFMLRIATSGWGYLLLAVAAFVESFFLAADKIIGAAEAAFGWIPGVGDAIKYSRKKFDEFGDSIVGKLRDAGNEAVNWGKKMDESNKKRKLEVEIGQWTEDLKKARDDLKNTLSKKAQKKLQMQIKDWSDKLEQARKDLLKTTNTKAKAKLEGTIDDLEKKIRRAKKLLSDQSRRKSKSAIKGDIADLERKLKQARGDLNNLNGKTANTYVVTHYTSTSQGGHPTQRRKATGGVVGMATGGLARASASARGVLVGEQGPEFVQLAAGSQVRPSGWTRQAMGGPGPERQATLKIEAGTSDMDRFLLRILRRAIRNEGGDVQVVLGTGR
jgi:predicted  nucleic acid-binding Zn-ribbon protein